MEVSCSVSVVVCRTNTDVSRPDFMSASTCNAVWRREVKPRRFGAGTGGSIQAPKWLLGQVELACRVMCEVIG